MTPLLAAVLKSVPGSFVCDGASSWAAVAGWSATGPRRLGDGQVEATCYRDPDTGLCVETTITTLADFAAVEWLVEFVNRGDQPSPVLEQIRPLDMSIACDTLDSAVVRTCNGSTSAIDDFLPHSVTVQPGDRVRFAPHGGRSSDGAFPFFVVAVGAIRMMIAVGWSGQWCMDLTRDDSRLRLDAGLENARLRLEPGERIRTPRILVADCNAAPPGEEGNVLRRMVTAHYAPRRDDARPTTPVAHMTMATHHKTGETNEATELMALQQAADLGVEAYWLDACWYGTGLPWSEEVGNWFVRQRAFPRGLRPISDATHAAGMAFVLWLEPERARRGTALAAKHPEFFLPCPDHPDDLLLDLGQPAARRHMTELISSLIQQNGVDIYRHDFNIAPLGAWRAADRPDREGMTEIRHIEGLYALWDELRRRHPGLTIDNCASGGRRIDLETASRSAPLWRSDFADVGGGGVGPTIDVANQVQTVGLSAWLPQHSGPVWDFEPYAFRSAMSTGVVVYCGIPRDPQQAETARRAIIELKRLRPCLAGELHHLHPLSTRADDWAAYQMHREKADAGFALFLRRHASGRSTMTCFLRGLSPHEHYEVTMSAGFEPTSKETVGADVLSHLTVSIPERPGSLLVEYARVNRA